MKKVLPIEWNDRKQGFTLIEIMIVIAVIGILAMVSIPKYQVITDHYKLESSAQKVVGQLRYAKQLAMDQRKEIYLVMDSNTVEVLDANGRKYGEPQTFASGVNFDTLQAESNGLMIVSGKVKGLPHVAYNARGFIVNSPFTGENIDMVLVVRTGRSVAIVVERVTGNLTVEW